MEAENVPITFSFGENWESFLRTISQDAIDSAQSNITTWLGPDTVSGKTVLDIGSGSGLHSLCFYLAGAKEIVSFDVDRHSIQATQSLWEKSNKPENWQIYHGSILDNDFTRTLDTYDIVYSWGVLHHTGAMWKAITQACSLVKKGGLFWIAIYVKGPAYGNDLALKQTFNRASVVGKKVIVTKEIAKRMLLRWKRNQNPFAWNVKHPRGMTAYHDLLDWLGGYPYEVASREEVVDFCRKRGFVPLKIEETSEGSNNVYLFQSEM